MQRENNEQNFSDKQDEILSTRTSFNINIGFVSYKMKMKECCWQLEWLICLFLELWSMLLRLYDEALEIVIKEINLSLKLLKCWKAKRTAAFVAYPNILYLSFAQEK